MYMMDTSTQAEAQYRAERVRRGWSGRRRARAAGTSRRWQGPLRGAEEMR